MTTVLCIDDEAEIRGLIVEELTEAGFATLEASNGREGLEVLISKWPDIVICDITMPEMDGHQLLAEIQINYPELANVPFIFLTAMTDKQNVVTGLRAGAADYLTKPIDFEILLAKIEGCVARIQNDIRHDRAFGSIGAHSGCVLVLRLPGAIVHGCDALGDRRKRSAELADRPVEVMA